MDSYTIIIGNIYSPIRAYYRDYFEDQNQIHNGSFITQKAKLW